VRRLLAVGAALLLLAAGFAGAYALWGRTELKTDGPLVVTDADWIFGTGASMDAMGGGVLTIDGDCVRLGDDPVVWPDGTSWDEDERTVRLPGDRLARPGDTIAGGGGYLTFDTEDEESRLGRLLGDCVSVGDEVLLFNDTEHLELERATTP
jgi:hypothetical protein